MGITIAPII